MSKPLRTYFILVIVSFLLSACGTGGSPVPLAETPEAVMSLTDTPMPSPTFTATPYPMVTSVKSFQTGRYRNLFKEYLVVSSRLFQFVGPFLNFPFKFIGVVLELPLLIFLKTMTEMKNNLIDRTIDPTQNIEKILALILLNKNRKQNVPEIAECLLAFRKRHSRKAVFLGHLLDQSPHGFEIIILNGATKGIKNS